MPTGRKAEDLGTAGGDGRIALLAMTSVVMASDLSSENRKSQVSSLKELTGTGLGCV